MEAKELDRDARHAIRYLYALRYNRTKILLRAAWQDGDYSRLGNLSDRDITSLQLLRNSHGPSWLDSVKLSTL